MLVQAIVLKALGAKLYSFKAVFGKDNVLFVSFKIVDEQMLDVATEKSLVFCYKDLAAVLCPKRYRVLSWGIKKTSILCKGVKRFLLWHRI